MRNEDLNKIKSVMRRLHDTAKSAPSFSYRDVIENRDWLRLIEIPSCATGLDFQVLLNLDSMRSIHIISTDNRKELKSLGMPIVLIDGKEWVDCRVFVEWLGHFVHFNESQVKTR